MASVPSTKQKKKKYRYSLSELKTLRYSPSVLELTSTIFLCFCHLCRPPLLITTFMKLSSSLSHFSPTIEPIHKFHYIISHIPPPEGMDEKLWSQSLHSLLGVGKFICFRLFHEKFTRWNVLRVIGFLLLYQLGYLLYKFDSKETPENLKTGHATEKHINEVLSVSKIRNKMKLKRFQLRCTRSDFFKKIIWYWWYGIMAVSSLHILMTQHGLEYPNCHEKLYALLVPQERYYEQISEVSQTMGSVLNLVLIGWKVTSDTFLTEVEDFCIDVRGN